MSYISGVGAAQRLPSFTALDFYVVTTKFLDIFISLWIFLLHKMDSKCFLSSVLLIFMMFWTFSVQIYLDDVSDSQSLRIYYSSAILKSFKTSTSLPSSMFNSIPRELRARRRGKRGGLRRKTRKRPFKPFLPTIVTGNARSLNNKMDELTANVRFMYEYREASLICFSETWFKDSSSVDVDGFS